MHRGSTDASGLHRCIPALQGQNTIKIKKLNPIQMTLIMHLRMATFDCDIGNSWCE